MMRRNVELKVKYPDLERAARIVDSLGAEFQGILEQTDIYFRCSHGRLKLRETEGSPAQLIWYDRSDEASARLSRYIVTHVPDVVVLKEMLSRSNGVLTEVRKSRELYIWENVRIHLDRVDAAGRFIEFEVVLDAGQTEEQGVRKLETLCHHLRIEPEARLAQSYADLVPR
jgi:adenylate cyclase class 2